MVVTAAPAVAPAEPTTARRPADRLRTVLALGVWAAVVLVAHLWGEELVEQGRRIKLNAPPLVGRFDWRVGWSTLLPVAMAAVVVWRGPALAARLPWRRLLAVAFLAAGVWAVAVAFVDGWHGVMRSQLESPSEYLLDVPKVESAGAFLDSFVDDIDQYVNHVRGHPPGLLLGLWGLDAAGLGGPRWTTALYVAGGAAAVPAVLVAVRSVAGDRRARVLAPFLVLAPATVWMATSADALFAGVAAWAVALVVVATTASEWRATAAAAAGGLLFGVALMLSYGLVLVAAVAGAVAVWRRRWREPLVALVAAAAVLAAFAAVGFSWFDGLDATRREYAESIASTRPYAYFLVANLAALAVATGPATATALSRLRPSGLAVLVAGAGLAVLAADVSGLSKGEVERIWLPFTVWLLAATAVLVGPLGRSARGWLAAQAGLALLVESAVRTAW